MQSPDKEEEFCDIKSWWLNELTPDERDDIRKAWLVLLTEGKVFKAPAGKATENLYTILSYLREKDQYWDARLMIVRPVKSIKWENMYHKVWRLTKDKPLGTP